MPVFILDITKQIISAVAIHFMNLMFSLLLHSTRNSNDCVWYFVSYVIDTLFSIPICVSLITLTNLLFKETKHEVASPESDFGTLLRP
jgi:hypothetical protein